MFKLKIKRRDLGFKSYALFTVLIIICLIIFGSFIVNTKKLTKEEQNISLKLDNHMEMAAKNDGFNGSVLVASKGKVLLAKGYGLADRENKVLCTEQTRFMIGSLTKQFTSMAIMQLEEKGLLSVNDNVKKYIPSFPYGEKITIHQLLSHISGLPRDFSLDVQPSSTKDALKMLINKGFELSFTPGEVFNYSNAGYQLLGLVIEKASGKTYEEYVQENIFNPLSMVNSGFGYDRNTNTKLAKSYETSGELITKDAHIDWVSIAMFSAGEIYSTIGDLYKWDRALYTEKLVSVKTLDKIFTPVINDYGYGWHIITPGHKGENWHDGLVFGFTSQELRVSKSDTYYLILSDNNNTTLSQIMATLSQELPK